MKKATIFAEGVLRAEVIAADSFFLRLRGLIGRNVEEVTGLLLTPCSQIHTFFMGSAIDVVYLDRDNRVLRVDEAVKPGKCCRPQRGGCSVLELAPGLAKEFGIAEGKSISIR